MTDELSELVGEDEVETEEETTETEVETEEEESSDEAEEEKAEGETTAPEEKEPEQPWTKAAVLDERQKRQRLEAEKAELESRLAEANKEATPRPDVFEDQEGAFQFITNQIQNETWQMKANLSRDFMADLKADYPEMESKFMEMAKDDPSLTQKMVKAVNPARFAYDTAKNAVEYAKMQNVDEYKAKLKAEAMEEAKAELLADAKKAEESEAKKSGADVPSLAAASSKGANKVDVGDQSLEEVFGR